MPLTGEGTVYAFPTSRMWSQVKSAGSAIYANRQYLAMYKRSQPKRLVGNKGKGDQEGPSVIGDVFIHPTAQIHPSCLVRKLVFRFLVLVISFKFIKGPSNSSLNP